MSRSGATRIACLLVEDNPADTAIVSAQLRQDEGVLVEVETADSLAGALAALGQRPFDVILLDLSLPDSDGLDTFIALHARAPFTPVVVLSGLDQSETVLEAVGLGAQDFLVKGRIPPGILLRSLQFAIARHGLARRMEARRSTATFPPATIQPLDPALPRLPLAPAARQAETRSQFSISGGLGRGGMCDVLLAHQINLDRDVAVKFLRTSHADPAHLAQFQAEARVTAWLEHPNIVPVHDLGENFFVMRRVQGKTLALLLSLPAQGDPLPGFIETLLKVCDAVAFAHSRGIIHRDIKPDNIMVGDFGQVLLLDWGLALTIEPQPDGRCIAPPIPQDPRAVCAGTLGFLAPEVARGEAGRVGYATDVFLLGATLYCILTGDAPFEGGNHLACLNAAAHCHHRPVLEAAPKAPSELARLCQQAMAPDPAQRPSVAAFQNGLRAWLMR